MVVLRFETIIAFKCADMHDVIIRAGCTAKAERDLTLTFACYAALSELDPLIAVLAEVIMFIILLSDI